MPGGAPPGISSQNYLETLTWKGAENRYSDGIPNKVSKQLIYELRLINELNYANYFTTVYDIVNFANQQNILCQGRGRVPGTKYSVGLQS